MLKAPAMGMSSAKLNMRKSDGAPSEAKKTHAVADRLRATEDALRAAQSMIAEQEKREKELKKFLATNGLPAEATPSPKLSGAAKRDDSAADTQLQAMKTVHDSKVRALMKSIHQLQEQIQSLKSQDKEHRRSALIQNLRKSQREQELMIDVLKQTLVEKVPEFQESRELVNDFIIKKAIGGPLRFRPQTREELENELELLDGKYKRAVENLKKMKEEGAVASATTTSKADCRQQSDHGEEEESDGEGVVARRTDGRRRDRRQVTIEKEVFVIDPAQQEEIDHLKIELASKNLTIHSQADEMHELYAEVERLRVVEEKLERKKERIEALEDKVNRLQLENVKILQEKEGEVEKNLELREELQFLRDTRVGDVQVSDSERLRQLELIQSLRAREEELQSEMEEQQKKWSVDRSNINQQMRLVEKEKDLLQEKLQRAGSDLQAMQKKHDRLFAECDGIKNQLTEAAAQRDTLKARIQELEETVALHESLSREQSEALSKTMSTRLRELEETLAEKDDLAKKLDRQLTAAKLLGRQAKKETDQLQERYAKLQEELASRHASG